VVAGSGIRENFVLLGRTRGAPLQDFRALGPRREDWPLSVQSSAFGVERSAPKGAVFLSYASPAFAKATAGWQDAVLSGGIVR
jgi:hypothetical protein